MRASIFTCLTLSVIILSACAPASESIEPQSLRVLVHDSFAINSDLVLGFEKDHNVQLEFIKAGDAGSVLNKAILTKSNPLADVIFGLDNAFLSRALENDLLDTYTPAGLADIPADLQLDKSKRAIPVDYGDVCINYDKAFFEEHKLALPKTLDDLTKPAYEGLLVMENPATSSPGMAFLLATISTLGEGNYIGYWTKLKANGLVVVNDWETAYYTNFSASSGKGSQPMVVSYGTSPAAEVVFAEEALEVSPTASLTSDGMCFRQIEFIGILKGGKNRQIAEKFIDFMLSVPVQEDIPLQMFVFPANPNATIPEVFVKNIQIPENPGKMNPDTINQNREIWLAEWTTAILR
jgi:thiamine transport system substrate-binding protein